MFTLDTPYTTFHFLFFFLAYILDNLIYKLFTCQNIAKETFKLM